MQAQCSLFHKEIREGAAGTMSDDYVPIDCGVHDELELACMRGKPLRLTTEGEILLGTPVTTRTSPDRAEWLLMSLPNGEREIRMDRILRIEALQADSGETSIDVTAQ
ncbi:MAG: Rho-binding antiterminator [Halioglobus sp.]|nr:Rho-binding antiterminator [Halioglobus sp.]